MDEHLHLVKPENFETWEFKLTFPFSSVTDFKRMVELLRKTGEKKAFAQLMDMRY